MRMFMLLAVIWATALALTPVIGSQLLRGRRRPRSSQSRSASSRSASACTAPCSSRSSATSPTPPLIGRYMALSAFSWQIGFTIGPAVGGFLLRRAAERDLGDSRPAVCLAAGFASTGAGAVDSARGAPLTRPRRGALGRAGVEFDGHADGRPPQYRMPNLPRIKRPRSRAAGRGRRAARAAAR